MCTLIALVGVVPGTPVVLAANRDEMYERPSRAPALLAPGLVGGLDLRSGGSWLAIARDGRFAGVTNQREAVREVAPRSRGELVVALAQRPDRAAMRAYVEALDATQYASGNLLFGDASGVDVAYVRRAGTLELAPLGRGVHVLTNDRIGSPAFPKADHAATRIASLLADGADVAWPALRAALPGILGDHATPPPDRIPPLPDGSMIPPELAATLQALCIHTPFYGTRSATLAAIGGGGTEALLWADGPPCTTPFVDAMPRYR
ncbi:MAG TPA: NRDE family protein [Kofleriaceae bacterium]|nr:NRDE family protein [Kofleriaceae bacterium]